jgi:hypothetical protein
MQEWIDQKNGSGCSDQLWSFSVTEYIQSINDFFLSLNFLDLLLYTHLLIGIFVLLCLISVITIVYSDQFIKYLKLETKYPKLAKIIQLRRKFQNYYLFLNLFLMFLASILLIGLNLYLLWVFRG